MTFFIFLDASNAAGEAHQQLESVERQADGILSRTKAIVLPYIRYIGAIHLTFVI